MSQEQESIQIYLWGFIESRGHIPALVEAYGDLTEEFALMNSTERAIELGFSAREASDLTSVFEGSDASGEFELRQTYLEDIEVNGTHVLFEEANDLAEAIEGLLTALERNEDHAEQVEHARTSLNAYDARWEIRRD